jgi:hypothetical protein
LKSAKVVVFVADSQPSAIAENKRAFEFLVRLLHEQAAQAIPAPSLIVHTVQVNKPDLPGAFTPLELAGNLGADAAIAVIGTQAIDGKGVLSVFVTFMRLEVLVNANVISHHVPEGSSPSELYSS